MNWLGRGIGILPIFVLAWLVAFTQFDQAGPWIWLLLGLSLTLTITLGFRLLFSRLVSVPVPLQCWLSCLSRCVGGFFAAVACGFFLFGFVMMAADTASLLSFAAVAVGLTGSVCILFNDVKIVRACLVGNAANRYTLSQRRKVGLPV